ncbi:MAG: thioredoxin family protein [Coriobacteriia bacterium]|nr:thioredoxin family protein [Coriobacteriia bacterium]
MTHEENANPDTSTPADGASAPAPGALSPRAKIAIIAVVLLALMAALVFRGGGAPSGVESADWAGAPATSQGPDPVAAYADALAAGRPIYVLFHSSSCPSCIEITQYSVDARPDYEGSVTFVDVLTDDPRARPLFSEFNFQYIPTLFFLAPDGSVIEQHTGPLAEEDLRQTLDGLAATAAGAGGS